MFSKLSCFAMLWLAIANDMANARVIQERDFSADLRNFNQIVQLLYNIRSRIGIPFSAMTNIGLSLPQILEVGPLDLALLPSGYCFSCESMLSNQSENRMVEIDEEQIIIICTSVDEEHGPELPFTKACPGQQEVLKHFLADLRTRGSMLAIPKERLEKAPLLEWKYASGEGGYRCVPKDENGTGCSIETAIIKTVVFKETLRLTTISTNGNFANYEKSMYLGVGTVLTSSPPYTASVVFPVSSQSLIGSTQVPSNSADRLISEYHEPIWPLLFGSLDETFSFTEFSTLLPSTMISLNPLDSRATTTYSRTTNPEAIRTKPSFSATSSSPIKSPVTTLSLSMFPKNHPSSSRRHDFPWSLSLSILTEPKKSVTRHSVSSSTYSSILMQSSSILLASTGNPNNGELPKLV